MSYPRSVNDRLRPARDVEMLQRDPVEPGTELLHLFIHLLDRPVVPVFLHPGTHIVPDELDHRGAVENRFQEPALSDLG